MGRRKKDLIDVGEIEVKQQEQPAPSKGKTGGRKQQAKANKQRVSTRGGRKVVIEKQSAWKKFVGYLKGLKAELKLVTWPPFRNTQKVKGVWANTGVVILVVLFFLIIMTAFDSGLGALLRLLVNRAS